MATTNIIVRWIVVKYRRHGERRGINRQRVELWLIDGVTGQKIKRLDRWG